MMMGIGAALCQEVIVVPAMYVFVAVVHWNKART
jgi:hypothetical protein